MQANNEEKTALAVELDEFRKRKCAIDRQLENVREEFEKRLSQETRQQYSELETSIREPYAKQRAVVTRELDELVKRREALNQQLARIRDEEEQAVSAILGRESLTGVRSNARVAPLALKNANDVIFGVLKGRPWQLVRTVAVAAHGLHPSMAINSFMTKVHALRTSGHLVSKPNPVQGEGVLVALPEDADEPTADANK